MIFRLLKANLYNIVVTINFLHLHNESCDKECKSNEAFCGYFATSFRYMRFHPETHATETLLAISGPIELWAA